MKLAARLVLLFALIGLFGVGIIAYLSHRVNTQQVQRFFEQEDERNGTFEDHEPAGRGPRGPRNPLAPGRQQLLEDLGQANLRAALLALSVSLAVGGYFAYRFTRPIAALTDTARRYGAGERSLRAPLTGNDELTELASVFNETADQLHLEQAQQQRLIADVAHELRTPLTILGSELEAMQDDLMDVTPENLNQLKGQVDLLGRLVQDLRFLILAEAGELELLSAPVDLADLIAETVAAFKAQADAKGVTLLTVLEPVTLRADADRLKQAFLNLLSNALRHSPEGGEVRL